MSQSTSPARKKQRLSSPSFDGDFDAEAFEALDRIELSLSQRPAPAPAPSQIRRQLSRTLSQEDRQRRLASIKIGLQGGDGGQTKQVPSRPMSRHNSSSFNQSSSTKASASSANIRHSRSSSNSGLDSSSSPQKQDYSDSFKPVAEDASFVLGFQTGSSIHMTDSIDPTAHRTVPKTPAVVGFTTASATVAAVPAAILTPSKAALEAAAKRLLEWEAEEGSESGTAANANASDMSLPRPVLASVLNSPGRQSTPVSGSLGPKSFSTPIRPSNPRAFKSPLLSNPIKRNVVYPKAGPTSSSSSRAHPLSSTPIVGHDHSSASQFSSGSMLANAEMRTPERVTKPISAEGSIGRRIPKAGFVTPFKPGMKPGDAGRVEMERSQRAKRMESLLRSSEALATNSTTRSPVSKPSRPTLKTCGLLPQSHTADELLDMGIDVNELSQITPALAPFYAFNAENVQSSASVLGPTEALSHLLRSKRTLATKEWVTNHWSLILWKLAGMVCLDPASESVASKRRWCWEEVIRQLEHRYDRELAGGQRPALRLIAAQDAPAAAPMVLCISQIIWQTSAESSSSSSLPPAQSTQRRKAAKKAVTKEPLPELEVTDGWYRMRAQVDEALARACKKGTIRVGRKIAVVGAKLDSQKKDAAEILQAYDSTVLVLSGNSTHLAEWHAKLGFQMNRPYPFIATLHSLTADGGNVSVLDIVIEKVHPVAYLEKVTTEDGEVIHEGPWNEADETRANDAWQSRRDAEESKVREELSKRWSRWEGYADRLERLSGKFQPAEDEMPPDHVEDLFDELDCTEPGEVAAFFHKLSLQEAFWLARFVNSKCERDRENAAEEIQSEVNEKCPPRDVLNFRIVVARDATPSRKGGRRRAFLTLWDILSLSVSEGGQAGKIEVGQRFLVTNLRPKQPNAWMRDEAGGESEIYLSTKRNSTFVRLK